MYEYFASASLCIIGIAFIVIGLYEKYKGGKKK